MQGMHAPPAGVAYGTTAPPANAVLLSDMMSKLQMHAGAGVTHGHGHQSPTGHAMPMHGHSALPQPSQGSQHALTSYSSTRSIENMDVMMQALRTSQMGGAAGLAAAGVAGAGIDQLQGAHSLVSVSLDLTTQQLCTVNEYMHSVQNISGAQLTVSVGAGPTLFRLAVSGTETQVETARALLRTIIQGA